MIGGGAGHGQGGPGTQGEERKDEDRVHVDSYQHNLSAAREFSKQNPKIVAEVVKEWIAKE